VATLRKKDRPRKAIRRQGNEKEERSSKNEEEKDLERENIRGPRGKKKRDLMAN